MEKQKTLKETLQKAAEFYEERAKMYEKKAGRIDNETSTLKKDLHKCCIFNRGRASAMREALAYLKEFETKKWVIESTDQLSGEKVPYIQREFDTKEEAQELCVFMNFMEKFDILHKVVMKDV